MGFLKQKAGMDIKQILCENIVKRRKKIGLSQAALAERLHITPEAMTRIEKGHISPKLSRLESIARNLHCSVPALFRHYSEGQSDNASIILDALSGLSAEAQSAIIALVLEAARALQGDSKD